ICPFWGPDRLVATRRPAACETLDVALTALSPSTAPELRAKSIAATAEPLNDMTRAIIATTIEGEGLLSLSFMHSSLGFRCRPYETTWSLGVAARLARLAPVAPARIGIDMLEIERLERALERRPNLAERLFTDAEREYAAAQARPG